MSPPAIVAHGSASIKGFLYLLSPVREFSRKQHLTALIVHNRDAGGLGTGVELDA
jgi:hypothetical protein